MRLILTLLFLILWFAYYEGRRGASKDIPIFAKATLILYTSQVFVLIYFILIISTLVTIFVLIYDILNLFNILYLKFDLQL